MKIGDVLADWLQLSAGMTQGSHLRHASLRHVRDFDSRAATGLSDAQYVDDTTMTEVLGRSAVSSMQQSFVHELVQQATDASMIVNGTGVNLMEFL